jgi:hypothetical protein
VRAISRGPLPVRYLKAFFAVWKAAREVDVVYVHGRLALLHVLAGRLAGKLVPVALRVTPQRLQHLARWNAVARTMHHHQSPEPELLRSL